MKLLFYSITFVKIYFLKFFLNVKTIHIEMIFFV